MAFPEDRRYGFIEWAVKCFGANREAAALTQAQLQLRALQTRGMNVQVTADQVVR